MTKKGLKKSRDITLDLMRGYFLYVIIVDHLRSFPSLLEIFTGRGELWISAAEGFFFVSGLLVGRLRLADAKKDFKIARHKLLKRAGQLYVVSVILTLFFTTTSRLLDYYPSVSLGVSNDPAWLMVVKTLTLQYSYGLADMLPLYVLFLLASIPALWLVVRGKAWLVVLISVSLWAIGCFSAVPIHLTKSYFSDLSWQVVFFGGFIIGCYYDQIRQMWRNLSSLLRRRILFALGLVLLLGLSLSVSNFYGHLFSGGLADIERSLFDKIQLGPGRLVLFSVIMCFSYLVIKHFEKWFVAWMGWFFLPLGQNSLYVYIVHSVIVFPLFAHSIKNNIWLATLEGVVVVLVVWWLTVNKVFFKYIPR